MNERKLFESALEISDPQLRQSFLDTACQGDDDLRGRVDALLSSHDSAGSFLEIPAADQMVRAVDDSQSHIRNTPLANQNADDLQSGTAATILVGNGSTQNGELDPSADDAHGTLPMPQHQDDSEEGTPLGYLEPSTKPDSLGRMGHYEILEVIGRGAFGTVLRALDEKLQRIVAIKVMSPEMASTSPARKRFIREAQASAAIRHEHVVSVYAVEEKPIPYLVMEYIPGKTLQQQLDGQGPLDVPSVLRIGRQIAEGLAAAHAQDLIHRDIKPGNILLESGAREMVKVTDFGLARAADDASMTQSGMIAGTPMYMAPEQALGHKLDQRADLFSFGSVLYQMLSGRPPFRANGTLAVLKRVIEDTPRPIREIIPEAPQWLCDIITKLHAKNPDERYQSAREIADVLADCEVQLNAHAKLQDFSRIPSSKSASSAKWKRFTAGGVVGAVLLLGVIIITLTNKDGTMTRIEVPEGADVSVNADRAAIASNNTLAPMKTTARSKRRFVSDEWIDVIPLIDPQTDKWDVPQRTGKNAWRIERGELMVGGDALASKLVLPLDSDWPAFECEVEFTRLAGDSGFNVNLPTKVGECPLLFDPTGNSGTFLGSRAKGVQLKSGSLLVTGERVTIRFDIRRQQDADHVSVALNGAAIGEWTGDRTAISHSYREGFPHHRRVSLWIHPGGNEFVFHRIRIRMLDGGTAESLRPVPRTPPVPVAKQELPTTFKNSIGMEFVFVPKGKSWLGGGKDKQGDREVEIPADFYLGKYEVTQEEWEQVMGQNPSYFSRTGGGKEAVMDVSDADLKRLPVETVSWDECQIFVAKLNQLENETGWDYRLPTATEWEYACRGGPMTDKADSAFDFYFARPTNNPLREQTNFGRNRGLNRTGKVGANEANGIGIFDMHRNVWEWCDDMTETADGNIKRVQMGGGWNLIRWRSAAANIESELPSHRSNALGLRLARVPTSH